MPEATITPAPTSVHMSGTSPNTAKPNATMVRSCM